MVIRCREQHLDPPRASRPGTERLSLRPGLRPEAGPSCHLRWCCERSDMVLHLRSSCPAGTDHMVRFPLAGSGRLVFMVGAESPRWGRNHEVSDLPRYLTK